MQETTNQKPINNMETPTIEQLIQLMIKEKHITPRQRWCWTWGKTQQECKALFTRIFSQVDDTIDRFIWLPEYDQIVDWMVNTNDKGLMLIGDCGRGKSLILNYVLPVLFRMHDRTVRPVHAQDLGRIFPNSIVTETYLDRLLRTNYPIIDEVGVEPMMNDYGEKTEGLNMILNAAERYHRPVFISTNLTELQLLDRYGERTVDRLAHLCRTVHFKGDSLRK